MSLPSASAHAHGGGVEGLVRLRGRESAEHGAAASASQAASSSTSTSTAEVTSAFLQTSAFAAAASRALPKTKQGWIDDTLFSYANLQKLETHFVIDGEIYQPRCNCLPPLPADAGKCYISKIQIQPLPPFPGKLSPGRRILDGNNLRKLIGDPSDLKVVSSTEHHYSCVDGRSSDELLGVWGGDMGILLLAMAVYDEKQLETQGTPLTGAEVQRAVKRWLKYTKRKLFYMHTDTDALAYVEAKTGTEDVDITVPPEDKMDALLKHLMEPQGIGCEHIRNLLVFAQEYGVRPELVKLTLQYFYRTMWDPLAPEARKIRYYILHAPKLNGEYTESAWVQFETDTICAEEEKIVAFPPWSDGVSIFINHPQGRRLLMRDAGLFVKGRSGGTWDSNELIEMATEKYEKWARLTEEKNDRLKGLPKFRVKFISHTPTDLGHDDGKNTAVEGGSK